ncbi:MAG: hypothetical protein LKJ25_01665 [Clostridia bacterium]|jgi:hypothetical protein|nr:hypothetical protein [Clostridia bacterium]
MELKQAKLLFNDKCDVYRCTEEKSGAVTKNTYSLKYDSVNCKLSFLKSGFDSETNTISTKNQSVRLFLESEPQIESGDVIIVYHMGTTVKYKAASEGKHYITHQETELDIFDENP